MKVLLVSISFVSPYTFHRRFLGLGYLHANVLSDDALRSRVEMDHIFFDQAGVSPREAAEEILAREPDLVGFGAFVWNTPHLFEIARRLKARRPGMRIILGGPQVDQDHLRVLEEQPAVDFISVGEGEENFRELLHALLDGTPPAEVAGIACRGPDGPALARGRTPSADLDRFPSPYLSGVLDVDARTRGAFFQTSRGCPYECGYCAWGRQRKVSEFSLERVAAELRFFRDHGAEALFCVDSIFNLNGRRAIRILEESVAISLKAALWLETHPRMLDPEFVSALGKTHLTYLGVGIQTLHPEAMKNINRPWDPDRIEQALEKLALHENCLPGFEIIMGLPGDNLESFKEALTWVYRKSPATVLPFTLQVIPNSPLFRAKEKFAIRDMGPDGFYQILSCNTFPADQVEMGNEMRNWSRLLQQVFYRLILASRRPAGEVIEAWARFAREEGLNAHLADYYVHELDRTRIDGLADAFEAFCSRRLKEAKLPDLSFPMREMLRYFLNRRKATHALVHIFRALDVHTITTSPRYNRIVKREDAPEGAGEAFTETFAYDMKRLWPLTGLAELEALPRETHTYAFHALEEGGCVAVDLTAE